MADIYKTTIEDYRLLILEELKDFFTDKKYVISRGVAAEHNAIFLYKEENWNTFEDKLKSFPMEDLDVRHINRYFRGSALDTEIENNTIPIPEPLFNWLCGYKDVRTIDVQMHFGDKFGCPLVIEVQEG